MFQNFCFYFTGYFITCNGTKRYFNNNILAILTRHIVLAAGIAMTPQGQQVSANLLASGALFGLAGRIGVAVTNDGRASIRNAGLVFAGYGITAPERNWDDYGDLDVRGKVVVLVSGEPDGALFNGQYATNYQAGAYKADEAFRRGAVGVITLVMADAASPMPG